MLETGHENNNCFGDEARSPLHRTSKSNGTVDEFQEAYVRNKVPFKRKILIPVLILVILLLIFALIVFVALYVNERTDNTKSKSSKGASKNVPESELCVTTDCVRIAVRK